MHFSSIKGVFSIWKEIFTNKICDKLPNCKYFEKSHRGHCDKRPPVGVQHSEELSITFSEKKMERRYIENIIFHVSYNFLKTLSHHFQLPLSQRQMSTRRIWAPEKEGDSSASPTSALCSLHHQHGDNPHPDWDEKEEETKLLVAVLESVTQRLQSSRMPRKLK